MSDWTMKKYLLALLLLFAVPSDIYALTINNSSVIGPNSATVGDTIKVKAKVEFAGLSKDGYKADGIAAVVLHFEVGDSLIFTNAYSVWNMELERIANTNEYILINAIDEDRPFDNACVDGYLYCGDTYEVELDFFVKDNNATENHISLKNIAVSTLKPEQLTKDLAEEDFKTSVNALYANYGIAIYEKQSTTPIVTPPAISSTETTTTDFQAAIKDVIKTEEPIKKPSQSTSSSTKPSSQPNGSNNNRLSSLTIENYDLKFYPDKEHYSLIVDNETEKLDLTVTTEDEKATYEISGAEHLEQGKENHIKITVTAENGNKKIYTLDTTFASKKKEWFPGKVNIFGYDIEKKYVVLGGLVLGVIVILIIVKIIFSIIKDKFDNRKINRVLKKMDK